MRKIRSSFAVALPAAAAAMAAAMVAVPASAHDGGSIQHVLVISVDGMHQVDLEKYLADPKHKNSALAQLTATGVEYTRNSTSRPSDSFPGLLAFFTGATPISHGVFYDDTYDATLYAPSGVSGAPCKPGTQGTEVSNFEYLDSSWNLAAGQVTDLFNNTIDPTHLVGRLLADGTCELIYPHLYLENNTNTVFEVLHQAGKHTAWSDKHPAYEILNGPSGKGLDTLYAPEINSTSVTFTLHTDNPTAYPNVVPANCDPIAPAHCDITLPNGTVVSYGDDWTTDPSFTRKYDQYKVNVVLNWIKGLDQNGNKDPKGTPAIFGMNFQAVSVAEKVTVAMQCTTTGVAAGDPLSPNCKAATTTRGGYTDAASTPTAPLEQSLEYVDGALGSMLAALKAEGLLDSTLFIVAAKHGQSPNNLADLHMMPGKNAYAIKDVTDPIDLLTADGISVAQETADDVSLLWLSHHSDTAAAVAYLETDQDNANTTRIARIYSGNKLKDVWGDPAGGRVPDIIIQPLHGTIYSKSAAKLSEHGGFTGTSSKSPDDNTHTLLVVSNPKLEAEVVDDPTTNMQIAPTILKAFGLDPNKLVGVQREGTKALPDLELDD